MMPSAFPVRALAAVALLLRFASAGCAADAAPPAAPAAPASALNVSLREAVLLCLERNQSLQVARLTPEIVALDEWREQARFDPQLQALLQASRQRDASHPGPGLWEKDLREEVSGSVGLSQYFPSGTTVLLEGSGAAQQGPGTSELGTLRFGATVTQALLRDRGTAVNLVGVRQARLDARISAYEFRAFVEQLVAAVETQYWDYVQARLQLAIVEQSLTLAEQQLQDARLRIDAGALAPAELPAAEAEVAQRREGVIVTRTAVQLARLALVRLLNPAGAGAWERDITPVDAVPDGIEPLPDAMRSVDVALRARPDMNQARHLVRRGELEVVRTRNGLLPRLDLFITLGRTSYASSFGGAIENVEDGRYYDLSAGLTLTHALGRRAETATYRQSQLRLDQERQALANLAQSIELDVRSALAETARAEAQIPATAATRRLREEALRVETEKYRNGRSTSLLVNQAQRDLLASQVAEVAARLNYRKALVALHRQEGTLLERRGLVLPGGAPADLPPGF